jgi:colanic acid/amylovoran biosynthesis glycosyltransferase
VLSQGNYDLSFDRLLDLYNRARLVVVSHFGSAHPIGLNAVVEAMAMAKPLVLTRGPGVDIDPEQGGFGQLVPAGAPNALAQAMLDIFNAPQDTLLALGAQSRAAAEQHYNSHRMTDDLVAALQAM